MILCNRPESSVADVSRPPHGMAEQTTAVGGSSSSAFPPLLSVSASLDAWVMSHSWEHLPVPVTLWCFAGRLSGSWSA